jgi:hypothetical protein
MENGTREVSAIAIWDRIRRKMLAKANGKAHFR